MPAPVAAPRVLPPELIEPDPALHDAAIEENV